MTQRPYLSVDFSRREITFAESSNVASTTLNTEQFLNFADLICASFRDGSFPLGDGIWFDMQSLTFTSRKTGLDFAFKTAEKWRSYLREAHFKALSFIKHGEHENCEYNARYATCISPMPGSWRITSSVRRQVLQGASSNANFNNDKRSKNSNISWRLHTNSRKYY